MKSDKDVACCAIEVAEDPVHYVPFIVSRMNRVFHCYSPVIIRLKIHYSAEPRPQRLISIPALEEFDGLDS